MQKFLAISFLFGCLNAVAQREELLSFNRFFIDPSTGEQVDLYQKDYRKVGVFISYSQQAKVEICSSSKGQIWLNGKYYGEGSNCSEILLDSLFSNLNIDEAVFLAFYSDTGIRDLKITILKPDFSENSPTIIYGRPSRDVFFESFVVLMLVYLLCVGAFIRFSPQRISFAFTKAFSLKGTLLENQNMSLNSISNLLFTLLTSFGLALVGIYYLQSTSPHLVVGSRWFLWAGGFFGLAVAVIVGKWLYCKIIARLYGYKGFADLQSFDFQNMLFLLSFLLVSFSFLQLIIFPTSVIGVVYWEVLLILFHFLYGIWIVTKLGSSLGLRKITIISYLCASELIPALLTVSSFLK